MHRLGRMVATPEGSIHVPTSSAETSAWATTVTSCEQKHWQKPPSESDCPRTGVAGAFCDTGWQRLHLQTLARETLACLTVGRPPPPSAQSSGQTATSATDRRTVNERNKSLTLRDYVHSKLVWAFVKFAAGRAEPISVWVWAKA